MKAEIQTCSGKSRRTDGTATINPEQDPQVKKGEQPGQPFSCPDFDGSCFSDLTSFRQESPAQQGLAASSKI